MGSTAGKSGAVRTSASQVLTLFSFLVADRVQVTSRAAKSSNNPKPAQYVFSSGADENSYEIYPDPRGETLGRGTEITLYLKPDALEYADTHTISELV